MVGNLEPGIWLGDDARPFPSGVVVTVVSPLIFGGNRPT